MPAMNDLGIAPVWSPHRLGLTTADGAVSTKKAEGVNSEAFNDIAVDVVLQSGSLTDLDVAVLFWSDAAGKFVVESPSITNINNTTGFQFTFQSTGRIFWIQVTSLTGTNPVVDIYVTGRPDR